LGPVIEVAAAGAQVGVAKPVLLRSR
jgi:hypothetical protein